MSTPAWTDGAAGGTDSTGLPDLERRLQGDLGALDDFVRELGQRQAATRDESRLSSGPAASAWGSRSATMLPNRINADPSTVEQDLAKLVLSVIDLIRQLLEKQAIRRIEANSLSDEEIERMGETFLKLDRKMTELKASFGLEDQDLSLSLGPIKDLLSDH